MTPPVENCIFDDGAAYGLTVMSIGYERRSSYLLRSGLRGRVNYSYAFEAPRGGAYRSNADLYQSAGYSILEVPEGSYGSDLESRVVDAGEANVAVDISSMTRRRLAATVLALNRAAVRARVSLEVDFYYCPAMFVQPDLDSVGVLRAGPLPGFEGPLRRASLPVGAMIGLGYEPHRALGIIEYLEPSAAWAFIPQSTADYEREVQAANESVLTLIPLDKQLRYSIDDPAGTVYALDSFVFAAGERRRIVLVPMGPKVFTLAALLVGLQSGYKRPAVWRVGESIHRKPAIAEEDGRVIGLRVRFSEGGSGLPVGA